MYTRQYKDFRGVDFSSARAECAPTRFNDLVNMWRDYHSEQGAAVETAPGFRALFGVEGEVHSLHYIPGSGELDENKNEILCYYVIHAGETLYVVEETEEEAVKKYKTRTVLGDRSDKRSQTVLFHNRLYFVDGKKYICVDGDRVIYHTSGGYVPITFLDGVPYEQKNLLTDSFKEKYTAPSYEEEREGEASVLHYTLHEQAISLYYFDGLKHEVYLFRGGKNHLLYPFAGEDGSSHLWGDGELSITATDKEAELTMRVVVGDINFPEEKTVSLGKATRIDEDDEERRYSYGGKDYGFTFVLEGNKIKAIEEIFFEKGSTCVHGFLLNEDAEIEINGTSAPSTFRSAGDLQDVLTGNPDFPEGYTAQEAIDGCTLITEFDGRIFLSGNPRLPNSVFYSQRDLTGYNNPFYIGCYNYLNDGTGKTPITAMITTPTQLIVLKDDVAQGAAIYYHYAQDNPSQDKVTADLQPRIYPRENGVPGVGCLGMACNFLDDPVFLSPKGLEAIGKSQVNLERTVTHRSSLVDARLCNEDLRRAVYAEWDGYLCILVPKGRMYLADSRQISEVSGSAQYEWYYLDDIGVYEDQKNRYHYVTGSNITEIGGKQVGHKPSGLYERTYVPDDADVQTTDVEGDTVGYVIEGGYAYIVESDGEQTGGTFKEATALLAVDGMLLFGCADGTVCMMNTDMRDERGFISQDAYTHNGRGYESYCVLCSDTCGVENATKSTVSGSFVVKCKAFPETGVSVAVRTNEIEWEDVDRIVVGRVDLSRMSFLSFTFNTMRENTALVREKEKRWVEKQVAFHDHCYMSPFGLLSATYDYKIAGKVRMR